MNQMGNSYGGGCFSVAGDDYSGEKKAGGGTPLLKLMDEETDRGASVWAAGTWDPIGWCAGRCTWGTCNGRIAFRRPVVSSSGPCTRCRGDRGVRSAMGQESWPWAAFSPRAANLVNRARWCLMAPAGKNFLVLRRAREKNRGIVQKRMVQFMCSTLTQKGRHPL